MAGESKSRKPNAVSSRLRKARLGELFRERREPGRSGLPTMSVTMADGIVDRESLDRRVLSDLRPEQHLLARRGDIAYNMMRMWQGVSGLVPYDCLVSPAYVILEPLDGIVPEFGAYLLRHEDTIRKLHRFSQGLTGDRLRLYYEQLKDILVAIPDTEAQATAARVLTSLDATIEASRAVIAQAHQLTTILQEGLLAKGIGHTRFRKTKIGQVPSAWHIETVGSLCEFSSGTGFSHLDWSTRGLPIIRIQNLNGSVEYNYYQGEPDPKWIVEPGELLFAWAGVKGVSFGPCIWPGPRGLLNQHIYRIRPNKGVDRRWLYAILGEVTHRIEAKAHGFKTSLVHVHKADITDQLVAVPPPDEQVEIARRVEDMEIWVTSQEDHLKQLESTKSALSQGLFTGRIPIRRRRTR